MTATLEQAVLDTSPHDVHDLSGHVLQADLAEAGAEAAPDATAPDALPGHDLISPDLWLEQWGLAHDMAGGMIHMRTGAPCALGAQARSEGGQIAARAAYDLIASSPVARLILGTHSTFIGQVLAIGMHGFACVQVVKASRAEGAALAFETRRAERNETARAS